MNDTLRMRRKAPVLPVLEWRSLRILGKMQAWDREGTAASVGFSSGTAAIAGALQHAGIGRGHAVMVPAFNCPSMLEPARGNGAANIVFGVCKDLSLDFIDAQRRVTPAARAIIVPHYFGFRQDMAAARNFCDQHGLCLIEDRAHAWFEAAGGGPEIAGGDYTVFSLRKFFAGGEGGLLTSHRIGRNEMQAGRPGLIAELKCMLNAFEEAAEFGRLAPFNRLLGLAAKAATSASQSRTRSPGAAAAQSATAEALFRYYDPAAQHTDMARFTRYVMQHARWASVRAARIANYQEIVASLSGANGIECLRPHLPAGVVPYMVPVLTNSDSAAYRHLRELGVPLFRWDESETGECAVARRYSTQLLQVPCHEGLRSADIDWIGSMLKEYLG